jgi:hypothetical protein
MSAVMLGFYSGLVDGGAAASEGKQTDIKLEDIEVPNLSLASRPHMLLIDCDAYGYEYVWFWWRLDT